MSIRSMNEIAKSMVGEDLQINGKEYGKVVDYFSVNEEYAIVLDNGRKLGLKSVLRAMNRYIKDVKYPDGTAYSNHFAGPKKLYRAQAHCAANIPNTAFNQDADNSIDISKRPGNGK